MLNVKSYHDKEMERMRIELELKKSKAWPIEDKKKQKNHLPVWIGTSEKETIVGVDIAKVSDQLVIF